MCNFEIMTIEITLQCPQCSSRNIVKNGQKSYAKVQNYACKDCKRQFIADFFLKYLGCLSNLTKKVQLMLVRGMGIRDIAAVEGISCQKVLSILVKSTFVFKPKQAYYDVLEVDEFWTYVHHKTNKLWLIYAYHRSTGEIVGWVWGKRNLKTAKKLKKKLFDLKIGFESIAIDRWNSFRTAFKDCICLIGKEFTKGIEGNNCRLRHRIRRAFRRSCNFSKKLENHIIAFEMAFFYINFGHI